MTPSATTTEGTLASQMRGSRAVTGAIEAIVDEVRRSGEQLTDVRGPRSEELSVSYQALMDAAAEVRGRPLLYPYVASGLGNGPLVELADGSVKFDLISGIGVHFFGHSDPDLVGEALVAATGDTVMQGHLQQNEDALRFTETLVARGARRARASATPSCAARARWPTRTR
jgi:acetylornithine/N-succinyldiaminopimelate aminotransferase